MIKVSVILPSLNVIKYIEECLESAVNQELKEIEILCVDAGSTDGTLEVIKKYVQDDSRVKLFISNYKSYGRQMNIGIDNASGEYIAILETDDYVPREMYLELYNVAKKYDSDFVKSDFYRFTGSGKEIKKNRVYLSTLDDIYEKKIDSTNDNRIFNLTMNTVTGIYKTSFLKQNNIRYNETPGASFQDNGFWFQTMMYAQNVYFVKKAYYMNRRDNENSSVYDKSKVFCICDEYEFLWNIIKNDNKLLKKYRFVFSSTCVGSYLYFVNRIEDDYKKMFLKRASQLFKELRDFNAFDWNLFDSETERKLLNIINDYELYYEEVVECNTRFEKELRESEKVILYGAGVVGKNMLMKLTYRSDPFSNIVFAVSKPGGDKEYNGVPIYCIDELSQYGNKATVVISVTKPFQKEMMEAARKIGFNKILLIPEESELEYVEFAMNEKYSEAAHRYYSCYLGNNYACIRNNSLWKYQLESLSGDNVELSKKLSDRVEMKKWIAERIGDQYIIPTLDIIEKDDKYDFGQYNNTAFIKDRRDIHAEVFISEKTLTKERAKGLIARWMSNLGYNKKELFSYKVKPGVIIEPALQPLSWDDYTVVTIDGTAKFIIADTNKEPWASQKRDVFDLNWKHQDVTIKYENSNHQINKPRFLNEMIKLSQVLSKGNGLLFVRFIESIEGVFVNKVTRTLDYGLSATYVSNIETINQLLV